MSTFFETHFVRDESRTIVQILDSPKPISDSEPKGLKLIWEKPFLYFSWCRGLSESVCFCCASFYFDFILSRKIFQSNSMSFAYLVFTIALWNSLARLSLSLSLSGCSDGNLTNFFSVQPFQCSWTFFSSFTLSISHSFSFYLPFFSLSVSQDFVGEGEKAGIKDNGTIQINRFSPKFDFHGEAKKSLERKMKFSFQRIHFFVRNWISLWWRSRFHSS